MQFEIHVKIQVCELYIRFYIFLMIKPFFRGGLDLPLLTEDGSWIVSVFFSNPKSIQNKVFLGWTVVHTAFNSTLFVCSFRFLSSKHPTRLFHPSLFSSKPRKIWSKKVISSVDRRQLRSGFVLISFNFYS